MFIPNLTWFIMKKLLFFACIISYAFNLSAQCDDTLPILEDFNDSSTVIGVCWNIFDGDGDGINWFWQEYNSSNGGHKCLTSRSWVLSQGGINPDNWIYSYAIDLTSYSTSDDLEVSWKVRAEIAGLAHEYYTLYAATGNLISDFESSSVFLSEYVDEAGGAGVFVTRSLDVSSLAGNMVYLAFRHQNISGWQFNINIDDVSISNSTLGIDDFQVNSFKYYYNTNTDVLILKSSNSALDSVEIYNILGQNVLNRSLSQSTETVNLSTLKDGIYIARIKIDNSVKTIKFLKH